MAAASGAPNIPGGPSLPHLGNKKPKRKAPRKLRFLEALRQVYHVGQALEQAGATPEELEEWCKDEAFDAAVDEAQERFIEDVETTLLRMGRAEIKGNPLCFISFLNAHHPDWGRITAEQLNRAFQPLFTAFLKVLQEEVNGETFNTIRKRFEDIKDLKFAKYSE